MDIRLWVFFLSTNQITWNNLKSCCCCCWWRYCDFMLTY